MKVTIIGDSIAMQYGPRVKELLQGEFEVWQPDENCRFSKYTLRGLFDWERDMRGTDIVHWNNGHWDLCNLFGDGPFTSEEEYIDNMLRILDILQKRYKTVIFATTPPLLRDGYNKNELVVRYNEIIVPVLMERGVIINDLHSLVSRDVKRYIDNDDCIHLSAEGIEVCAEQVISYIRDAARNISGNTYVDCNESEADKTAKPVL